MIPSHGTDEKRGDQHRHVEHQVTLQTMHERDAYVAACDALESALTQARAHLQRGDAILAELVDLMRDVEQDISAWTALLPFHAPSVQDMLRACVSAHPRELRSVPIRRLRSAGLLAAHAFRGDHDARLTDALPAFERLLAVAREHRPPRR